MCQNMTICLKHGLPFKRVDSFNPLKTKSKLLYSKKKFRTAQ